MTIAIATRKTLIAALFVPAIALTGVTAEAFVGKSDAQAQQLQRAPQRSVNRVPGIPGGGGNGPSAPPLRPCPPGTITHVVDCRPWTPPRRVASEDKCECHVKYQTINGQRVAVRDCYVLLPNDQVYYCENQRLMRR
jgi:hypothetical protein